MITYRFLEPHDVLVLRGNKLFGDPGSFGASVMPPWPSVAAGAIRSHLLAMEQVDLAAFAAGRVNHPALGTPSEPGSFRLTAFHLARRGSGMLEAMHPLPADLVAARDGEGALQVSALQPTAPTAGVLTSAPLQLLPALAAEARGKPVVGLWMNQSGWSAYLRGELPGTQTLVEARSLWEIEPRVGVGLDAERRRAADGSLFTVQAVAFHRGVGFLAGIDGAEPPRQGTLRLGGDGRAAHMHAVAHEPPRPDYNAIAAARRCRLVLTSPGIFPGGWRLPGMAPDGTFVLGGVRGQVVSAAVPRAEVISGWDLAAWSRDEARRRGPKAAHRAVPTGSVYWLDMLEASSEQLQDLVDDGLWEDAHRDPGRRAEGFNRCELAAWP